MVVVGGENHGPLLPAKSRGKMVNRGNDFAGEGGYGELIGRIKGVINDIDDEEGRDILGWIWHIKGTMTFVLID